MKHIWFARFLWDCIVVSDYLLKNTKYLIVHECVSICNYFTTLLTDCRLIFGTDCPRVLVHSSTFLTQGRFKAKTTPCGRTKTHPTVWKEENPVCLDLWARGGLLWYIPLSVTSLLYQRISKEFVLNISRCQLTIDKDWEWFTSEQPIIFFKIFTWMTHGLPAGSI